MSKTLLLQSPSFDLLSGTNDSAFCLQSPGRTLDIITGCEVIQRGRSYSINNADFSAATHKRDHIQDVHGAAEELSITYPAAHNLVLGVRFRFYQNRPFVLLRLELTNTGEKSLPVRRFFFKTCPEGLKSVEPPTGFYRTGWQSWSATGFMAASSREPHLSFLERYAQGPMIHNGLTPWTGKVSRFWAETVGAVVTPREALVAGGASLADQFVQVYADLRPNHQALMVQSQVDDVPLEPGQTCTSEWFYLEWVALPNLDPLAQYAYAVARQMEVPNLPPVPTGWCSWYIFWNKVSEAAMVDNLASAALLADELPLQVFQLDEGYQVNWGDWTERNDRFPHSLGWLAERIKGSGFTPGLWLGPFTAHPKANIARQHPDWLLHTQRGRPVSAGLISNSRSRALDTTHPGVQEHLRELISEAVTEWGYPYLKLDFLYAAALPGQRYNRYVTRAQAYRQAMQLIRETAGKEVFLIGCGAPLGPSVGLVDAMRIGPDTAPLWPPEFNGLRRPVRDNPSLPSLRNSLRNVSGSAWMHGRWWLNDPDTLMIRSFATELTEDEVVAQATLLGLSGGLLIVSDDLSHLSPERRAIAAACLPPLVQGMDVLDIFKQEMPEMVISPVDRSWGHWRLLGLFNWSDKPVKREFPRNLPDFDCRRAYHLVDFWKRKYTYLEPGGILPSLSMQPHSGMLFGLHPVKSGPHLVATTFHISQGGEITSWRLNTASLELSLSIGRLARGQVWLALPMRPHTVTWNGETLSSLAVHAIAPGVWAVDLLANREGTLVAKWES